ncbi:MAG TPA: DUF5709 domain-containing protein [Streptosporangiaceae bacterium]|nr:DUF5709 domain-containing protein [Streptosporangiaceae bacterium]
MREPGRDPESSLEDEGIPDMQDGTPQQQWANDPQQAPVPGDEPMAVDDYGTTAEEQHESEPLDQRLAREEPEPAEPGAPGEPVSAGGDERAGPFRIVEPDEGAAPDTEKEMIADDVGPDPGGYSPEERAVRIDTGEPAYLRRRPAEDE